MSTGPIVPPGQYPPFAPISDHDHRAWIIIATALGLSMTFLSSTIRASIRFTINRGWGLDDITLTVSTAISWIQSILVLVACSKGLGMSLHEIPSTRQNEILKLYYASNLVFLVSLGLSKASGFLLLLRVTPIKRQQQLVHILLGLVAIWTVAALFAVGLQCGDSRPWLVAGRSCGSDTLITWEALEVFACLFELAMVLFSLLVVWPVQISFDNKLVIVSAFTFRLGLIIVAGFRLGAFDKTGLNLDPTLLEASFICWTQAEMNYSIVSTTIPSATTFVKSLSTNYGVARGVTSNDASYAPGSRLDGKSRAGSTLGGSARRISHKSFEPIHLSRIDIRKDQFQGLATHDVEDSRRGPRYVANAFSGIRDHTDSQPADAKSVGSHDSQQMIIRKDVTFQIQRD